MEIVIEPFWTRFVFFYEDDTPTRDDIEKLQNVLSKGTTGPNTVYGLRDTDHKRITIREDIK